MRDVLGLMLDNFTTLCLVVGLGILILTNKNLDKRTNRYFMMFVILVLALVMVDTGDRYLTTFSEPSVWRYITTAAGYTMRVASIMLMINILMRRKKLSILFWMPTVILGVIAFTSYCTHWMFFFDDHNDFIRGPLSYMPHIISGIYLAVLVVMTISMHRNIAASEIFVTIYSAMICVIATAFESALSSHQFLLSGAMITACALYYVVLYIETYKRDVLTGLMNRRSFYIDAKRMQNNDIAVLSIDLNRLKETNDSYGHSAGDKALQSMAKAMTGMGGGNFLAYRVGGDEFMALGKDQASADVQKYINDMSTVLKKDKMTASFGYAFYKPGDNFDDICNQADARMYEDKKHYRQRDS